MHATRYIWCVSVLTFWCAPGIAAEPKDQNEVPFWELTATIELPRLGASTITLVGTPDVQRGLAVIQIGADTPPVDYVPSNRDLAPYLPPQDSGYRAITKGLVVGAVPFGDRKYKIERLPRDLNGLTLLQTKMGHKGIVDGRYGIVLATAKPCYVFLAIDERALDTYIRHGVPGWLKEYAPTGHRIKTDEPIMTQMGADYLVFVRLAPAGRIVLGPPAMDVQMNSMYFAFFGEANP